MKQIRKLNNNNPALEKIINKNKIKSLYDKYKDFVNDEMPDFKNIDIDFFSLKKHFIAMVEPPKNNQTKYILHINQKALKLLYENNIPLYYHEFTHIYDNYSLFKEISNNEKADILNFYTEFHATLIQLKIATGFKNINESRILTLDSLYIDHFDKKTIEEHLNNLKVEYSIINLQNIIISKNPEESANEFNSLVNFLMYFFAEYYFIKCYLNSDMFKEEFFDFKPFETIFGQEIYFIKDILCNDSSDNIDFKELKENEEAIKTNFINKYKK